MFGDCAGFIGRTCAARRGDCFGMFLSGALLVGYAPRDGGEAEAVIAMFGSVLLLVGLAATAVAFIFRRA